MIKTVKDKIVEIFGALAGDNKPLKAVFAYGQPIPKQYPCAMIIWNNRGPEERLDSASNYVPFSFIARVLVREKNDQASEEQVMDLADSLTDALRTVQNIDTLQGLVQSFEIGEAQRLHANEDQPVFGFDLLLTGRKIKSIS